MIPNSPEKLQGTRIEPPPSVPSAKGVIPAATEAAAPALEPPGVLARFHGLRVIPVSRLSPTGLQPNSLVVVLPIRIPPAACARSTDGRVHRRHVLGHRLGAGGVDDVLDCDEILYGKRNAVKGAELLTLHHAVFGRLAAAKAASGISKLKAFSVFCVDSAASKARLVISTGDNSFLTIRCLISTADMRPTLLT